MNEGAALTPSFKKDTATVEVEIIKPVRIAGEVYRPDGKEPMVVEVSKADAVTLISQNQAIAVEAAQMVEAVETETKTKTPGKTPAKPPTDKAPAKS